MRHVVILAHPDPASFNAAVASAYAEAARSFGHQAAVRDLYRQDFDPRLTLRELPGRGEAPSADVAAEREALAGADAIAFVYPLWFNAPPAMLKGYVERVMGSGFGFEAARGTMQPLLRGKSLVTVSTSGAPDQWVDQTGAVRRLRESFDDHLANVCGLAVLEHLNLGGITPGIRADAVESLLDSVRELVRRLFGPASG